jgi:hypothetical protein
MLPNIRAVFATIAVAVALLIIASGVVATFRIAQESRAGSLHVDLAQRGHAVAPQPQPIVVIETPGPTLLAKAPEPAPPRAPQEQAPVRDDATLAEKDETAPVATPAPEPSAVAAVPSQPDSENSPTVAASASPLESPPAAASEPPPDPPAPPALVAAAPQPEEAKVEPARPAPTVAGIGGPSPEEIAQARAHAQIRANARAQALARQKAAERARARKAVAEKARKLRIARLARERKLAARRAAAARARQQASPPTAQATRAQSGFGFNPAGSFTSAPFGNTFNTGGATNRR